MHQSLFIRKKGGVDGAIQFRAGMGVPSTHYKWEQNIVSQVIKTLSVNAFDGCRIFQRQELLGTDESLVSLDIYRNNLNKVQTMGDFIEDAAGGLLTHAASLLEDKNLEVAGGSVDKEESKRLTKVEKGQKRKRLMWLNSIDGIKLRFTVTGHSPVQERSLFFCVLYGQNRHVWSGHRSSFSCKIFLPPCVSERTMGSSTVALMYGMKAKFLSTEIVLGDLKSLIVAGGIARVAIRGPHKP